MGKVASETGEGDDIVIANVGKCEIDRPGKWDVVLLPMKKGKGWFVKSATFSQDSISIVVDEENWEVRVEVNGKENKLKKLIDGEVKYIPLKMRCGVRVPMWVIKDNLKEKITFLQLSPEFSQRDFINEFSDRCSEMMDKWSGSRFRNYIPNTPFADALKKLKS